MGKTSQGLCRYWWAQKSTTNLFHRIFCNTAYGLIMPWGSDQSAPSQIFAARLALAMPEAGFRNIKEITGPNSNHHHATLLDTSEMLLVYETVDAAPNIVMQRGPFDVWYPLADGSFPVAGKLSEQVPQGGDLHAAVGPQNTVWVAFSDASGPCAGSKTRAIAVPPAGSTASPLPMRPARGHEGHREFHHRKPLL
jgi:hypothetical protein